MVNNSPWESNLALFIDFDNVALGARDAGQRFDVNMLLQRVLEKGKIVVKRAYADWHYYKEHMAPLHEAAIEMIEVPTPKISGKNSADIRLVVDALDLCYSKEHIDTFVIVSGDSDFSPLVSKLRENAKRVIGIGVRSSSSKLLIGNCDEFIFYDDIFGGAIGRLDRSLSDVPADKRSLFEFLVSTTQSLLQESRGSLYSSLIKDTMKRKQPEFNEANYGYSTFGDLLDEAKHLGLLVVERDARAGGTWVVQRLGAGVAISTPSRAKRSRRRGRRKRSAREGETTAAGVAADRAAEETTGASPASEKAAARTTETPEAATPPAAAGAEGQATAARADSAAAAGSSATSRQTTKKGSAKTSKKKTAKKTAKTAKKTAKKAAKKTAKTTKKTAKKTSEKPAKRPRRRKKADKKAAEKASTRDATAVYEKPSARGDESGGTPASAAAGATPSAIGAIVEPPTPRRP